MKLIVVQALSGAPDSEFCRILHTFRWTRDWVESLHKICNHLSATPSPNAQLSTATSPRRLEIVEKYLFLVENDILERNSFKKPKTVRHHPSE
uniref:Uncharacterized protein n=1 Tax=Romanomermis culicivorax TaxID=13658 RepID=A0A915IKE1_ROMCU